MPDDFSLFTSQRYYFSLIDYGTFVLGREVCVIFYPLKVVLEFQDNVVALLYAIFEFFVHVRTIKEIDCIDHCRFVTDPIHLQRAFINTAQNSFCVINFYAHRQTGIDTLCKQKLFLCQ